MATHVETHIAMVTGLTTTSFDWIGGSHRPHVAHVLQQLACVNTAVTASDNSNIHTNDNQLVFHQGVQSMDRHQHRLSQALLPPPLSQRHPHRPRRRLGKPELLI